MSRWPWVPKPWPGFTRSSLMTRRSEKPMKRWVVVVGEGEGVAGVEPAVIEVAPVLGASDGEHGAYLGAGGFPGKATSGYWGACRRPPWRSRSSCCSRRHPREKRFLHPRTAWRWPAPDAGAVRVPSAPGAWGGPRTGEEPTLSDRVADYDIRAVLDPVKHVVTASEKLTWRNRSAVPIRSVYLHLYLNAFESEGSTFMTERRRLRRVPHRRGDPRRGMGLRRAAARRAGRPPRPLDLRPPRRRPGDRPHGGAGGPARGRSPGRHDHAPDRLHEPAAPRGGALRLVRLASTWSGSGTRRSGCSSFPASAAPPARAGTSTSTT